MPVFVPPWVGQGILMAFPGPGLTWQQTRDALNAVSLGGSFPCFAWVNSTPGASLYDIGRSWSEWDCSGLPEGCDLAAKVICWQVKDVPGKTYVVAAPAGPQAAGQYDEFGTVDWGHASYAGAGNYDIPLNALGLAQITKGLVRLAVRCSKDFENVAPVVGDPLLYSNIHGESGQGGIDRLEITYHRPLRRHYAYRRHEL